MNTPNRFAIYARISKDREGAGLGIERQVDDCTELVRRLDGTVAATYTDNDISAYSGKPRPGYAALLTAMRTGEIDAVVAWHSDRLHRSMVELEDYVSASELHGVATHTVRAGLIDLSTPSGRLIARQMGAVARYEVEHAIERQLAAKLQAAKAGLPSGGNRPYGYEQNGMVIIEHEAAIVREVIDRFIAGDSWRSIAIDLNHRGVPTAKGNKWTPINVRNVAIRPRNIGIRVHNDNQYPAQWEPLVSQEIWEALQLAIRRGQSLYGARGRGKKHLLSGFVYCGLCGTRMHVVNSATRGNDYVPAFVCRKFDVNREPLGCGKVKRRKPPLEDLVIESVLYRLETPRLEELIAGTKSAGPEVTQLLRDRDAQQQRLHEIVELYSTGELDFSEYKLAKTMATAHLKELEKKVAKQSSKQALVSIPAGQSVREAWQESDLKWKREILDALIEKIYVDPRILGQAMPRYRQWRFDPKLIRIVWRA